MLWLLDKLVMPMARAAPAVEEAAAAAANGAAVAGGKSEGDAISSERVMEEEDEDEEDEDSGRFFTIFIGDDKTDEVRGRAILCACGGYSIRKPRVRMILRSIVRQKAPFLGCTKYVSGRAITGVSIPNRHHHYYHLASLPVPPVRPCVCAEI